jgi:GxxExxY protein
MAELLLKDEVYAVIGAAQDVYYTLGIGFAEPIYQEALGIELQRRRIPFESQTPLSLTYKDVLLDKKYFADFVCYGQIIVELKALQGITNIEVAQLINYLKITRMHVGLLINFGSVAKLEWKRFVI